ncbi:MAG: ABC transporter permease [Planctomycetes bacterium]|nr:ABC transporter permease [Planctomycetota bacterium]
MTQIIAIAKRELMALYYSPIAYVVLALFALGTTMFFFLNFETGAAATMRNVFEGVVWLMVFLVPAISMRMLSDEFRAGTIEMLMTSPISDTDVVIGKWLGAMGFFVTLLSPLVLLTAVLEIFSSPDYGPIFTGFLGLVLVGGLYLAIGAFASATTQNQIIAFLISLFIICFLTIIMYYLPQASFVGGGLRTAMFYANVNHQFEDFNKGLIDIRNLVYFFSGIALFLFLAIKLVESKRWR